MVMNIPDIHIQKCLMLIFPGVELLSFTLENTQKFNRRVRQSIIV